jgi:LemA protein
MLAEIVWLPWAILAAVVLLILLWGIGVYNGLIARQGEAQNAWSQIDVQLKRRYDLIPNLVETVKGYASHEKETLERVIQARNAAMNVRGIAERAEAETALTGAMRQLLMLAEAYPELKANENFKALQEELISTENRIGFARQHYNDVVARYNVCLRRFPANIIAGLFRFPEYEFFQVESAEAQQVRQAPKVQF